ncbi:protein Eaa, partial [Klebsiella michiganensis]
MTSKSTREERVQSLYDLKIGQVLNQSDIESIKMLARMALAAMDSEPVAWEVKGVLCQSLDEANKYVGIPEPLYLHAQQPVVPDERAAFNAWNNEDNLPIAGVGAKNAAWLAWQARAELA